MRNLKRALSLTLASVMLLGMMVVGAGVLEVAQSAHHHGGGLDCGDAVTGAVGVAVVAGDNAVGIAGGYIGNFPPYFLYFPTVC